MIFEGVERAAVQLGGEVAGDTIDLLLAIGERSPAAVRKGNLARQLATATQLSRAIFSPDWVEGKNDAILLGRVAAKADYAHFNRVLVAEVFGCAGAGAAGAPSRSGVSVRSKRTS